MQDHPPTRPQSARQTRSRSVSLGILAGVSAIALAVGSGTAWLTWHALNAKPTPPTVAQVPASPQPAQPQPSQATAEQTVQIYWLKSAGNQIELAPNTVALNATRQPSDILKAAFEKMLQGTTDPTLASTIPQGTKLRDVKVTSDGVHVDFSKEFTSGGGSTSMTGRIAQVIYTATTLDPNAQVWISVDGRPLDVLGGEGLLLDQPMTRKRFQQNFNL